MGDTRREARRVGLRAPGAKPLSNQQKALCAQLSTSITPGMGKTLNTVQLVMNDEFGGVWKPCSWVAFLVLIENSLNYIP